MPKIKVQRTKNLKKLNEIEQEKSTGFLLLKSSTRGTINGQTTKSIPTGYALEIPEGYYGLVIGPSGYINFMGLGIKPAIITASDREEVILTAFNYLYRPETIETGTVVGRVILLPIVEQTIKAVSKIKKVSNS